MKKKAVFYHAGCRFCEPVPCGAQYTGEYLMMETSPCAPDNNLCGTRIGAVDFCELESVVNPR
jgi:hypothetical protein